MTIPAAWYPDPQDAERLRWWDGAGWTENTQPVETPAPQVGAVAPNLFSEPSALSSLPESELPISQQTLFGQPPPKSTETPFVADTGQNPFYGSGYTAMGAMDQVRAAKSSLETGNFRRRSGTVAIWLWVFMPAFQIAGAVIVGILASVIIAALDGSFTNVTADTYGFAEIGGLASGLVAWIAYLALANGDRKALTKREFERPPSALFALVPLIYMIVRAARTGAGGVGFLILWIVVSAITYGGILLAAVLVLHLEFVLPS
jgi:Protein of unknown function (DUF2510)